MYGCVGCERAQAKAAAAHELAREGLSLTARAAGSGGLRWAPAGSGYCTLLRIAAGGPRDMNKVKTDKT